MGLHEKAPKDMVSRMADGGGSDWPGHAPWGSQHADVEDQPPKVASSHDNNRQEQR